MKIGVLTSGGDCPGLNAVIRAIGLYITENLPDAELLGIPDGYGGLIRGEFFPLKREDFADILNLGGTILGTSRQPFKQMTRPEEDGTSRLKKMVDNYRKSRLDCLFVLGGAGTHKNAALLSAEGCHVIGLPKTIDNDIYGTDMTFGFQTAVEVAVEAIDRIRTTAESHLRTMLIEVMGNKAGWLALHAGIAGGADVILLPEIPFSPDAVVEKVLRNREQGERFSLIVVAEGAFLSDEAGLKKKERQFVRKERGESTVTPHLAEILEERTGIETRATVLGYLQRGGTPSAYDRFLASRFGGEAARLCAAGHFGVTVALNGGNVVYNALSDIAGRDKPVDPKGEAVRFARDIGIFFGTK